MTSARSGNNPTGPPRSPWSTPGSIDFGRPVIRWRIGGLSGRWDRREVVVGTVAAVATVVVAIVALGMGDLTVSPVGVVNALLGTGDPAAELAIRGGRRPGCSQPSRWRRTRPVRGHLSAPDPQSLGSPDIIGLASARTQARWW